VGWENRGPRRQVFVGGVENRGPRRQVFVGGVENRGPRRQVGTLWVVGGVGDRLYRLRKNSPQR